MQKMEHIIASWSVHTALQTIASNIKGFASKFACKSAYASCVNWALGRGLVVVTELFCLALPSAGH